MSVARPQVELLEKNRPRQARAKRTYESILVAAAQLLLEVGVERVSTNMMAERAGVTVPALYRYFPNKYAVLNALGAGLMDKQNEVAAAWLETFLAADDPQHLLDNIDQLLRDTYVLTRDQLAGVEIIQSLRAVGPLQELRLVSNRLVAEQFAQVLGELFSRSPDALLLLQARVSVDMGYAIVEMALEDDALEAASVLEQGAKMLRLYWQDILRARPA